MQKTLKWHAIDKRQCVAWLYFDSKICLINKMITRPAPMPWNIREESKN
ncbi:hypothetical protein LCGC14_2548770 [marine sediment metagenome]|uniref:Uncharacterized protein n=1 Tax=marine sediment metagenome TaxID=412755 RepID=A0A0F9AP03_9ZZZZ